MALNTPNPPTDTHSPADAPGVNQQQPAGRLRRVTGRYGMLHPRWPLLAAMIFMPLTLAGEGLKLYNHCLIASLCSLDTLPGIAQVTLIWLAFLVMWFVVALVGYPLEDQPASQLGPVALLLRGISHYLAIGPLVAAYGAAALVMLTVSLLTGRIDPPALALGFILVFVAGCLLAPRRPPRAQSEEARRAAQIGQATSLSFRLRSLPLVQRLLQPRANPRRRNPAGANAPAPPPPLPN
jgi:hypothetical protein